MRDQRRSGAIGTGMGRGDAEPSRPDDPLRVGDGGGPWAFGDPTDPGLISPVAASYGPPPDPYASAYTDPHAEPPSWREDARRDTHPVAEEAVQPRSSSSSFGALPAVTGRGRWAARQGAGGRGGVGALPLGGPAAGRPGAAHWRGRRPSAAPGREATTDAPPTPGTDYQARAPRPSAAPPPHALDQVDMLDLVDVGAPPWQGALPALPPDPSHAADGYAADGYAVAAIPTWPLPGGGTGVASPPAVAPAPPGTRAHPSRGLAGATDLLALEAALQEQGRRATAAAIRADAFGAVLEQFDHLGRGAAPWERDTLLRAAARVRRLYEQEVGARAQAEAARQATLLRLGGQRS